MHKYRFRVEWADTDAAGIVFYPNFFKWFDSGTWRLLIEAGLTHSVLRDSYGLLGCPIVEANSRFLSPAKFWDEVESSTYVESWRERSFIVAHEIRVGDKLCATGWEKRVMARSSDKPGVTLEAIPIPEEIRSILPAAK